MKFKFKSGYWCICRETGNLRGVVYRVKREVLTLKARQKQDDAINSW